MVSTTREQSYICLQILVVHECIQSIVHQDYPRTIPNNIYILLHSCFVFLFQYFVVLTDKVLLIKNK